MTGGLGYGYVDGHFASRPIVMLGGESRLSRRVAFVSENYGFWHTEDRFICAPSCQTVSRTVGDAVVSYGLRFMGEKLSTDFAFGNSLKNAIFPGIPYLAFAVKF